MAYINLQNYRLSSILLGSEVILAVVESWPLVLYRDLNKSQCIHCLLGQKKWPLYRGDHCGEVAVSGGATVNYLWLTVQKWVC